MAELTKLLLNGNESLHRHPDGPCHERENDRRT